MLRLRARLAPHSLAFQLAVAAATLATPERAGAIELLVNGGFDEECTDVDGQAFCPGWTSGARGLVYDEESPTGFRTAEKIAPEGIVAGLWRIDDAFRLGAGGGGVFRPYGLFPLVATSGTQALGYQPDRNEDTVFFQPFTVPELAGAVSVSFDLWLTNHPSQVSPCGLDTDYADPDCLPFANSLFRADILSGDANPFEVGDAVAAELFTGLEPIVFEKPPECQDGDPEPAPCEPWLHIAFDLTDALIPGDDYLIRFGLSYQGGNLAELPTPLIDSASVAVTLVPEPSTAVLLAAGLVGLAAGRRSARSP